MQRANRHMEMESDPASCIYSHAIKIKYDFFFT